MALGKWPRKKYRLASMVLWLHDDPRQDVDHALRVMDHQQRAWGIPSIGHPIEHAEQGK